MRKYLPVLMFLLFSISVATTGFVEAQEGGTRYNAYYLQGELNERMVEVISSMVDSGDLEVLILNSTTLNEALALDVAEAIEGNGITVLIEGVCVGACFSVIALAADQVLVRDGAVYAFGGSTYGIAHSDPVALRHYSTSEMDSEIIDRSSALYLRRSIPTNVLVDAVEYLSPISDFRVRSDGTPSFVTWHALWVPSMEYLNNNGIVLQGFVIESAEDARHRISTNLDLSSYSASDPWVYR